MEAEKAFRSAIQLAPKNATYWNNLGGILDTESTRNEAESALRKAVDLKPNYISALVKLATILKNKGDKAGAYALFQRARHAKVETPGDMMTVAYSFDLLGDSAAARDAYTQGLRFNPNEADVLLNMPENVKEMDVKKSKH
ncbi:MAG: hypothetical protein HYX67_02480 [Candidatus Melainabacteria bacterium]|nr:hypothetical protein [Candidatus Melainabacteria bacterium]